MRSLSTQDVYSTKGGSTMSTLIHIHNEETFSTYMDVLNGEDHVGIRPAGFVSSSHKPYGIFNEKFGWIKDIHVDIISEELQIGFTPRKDHALAIEGILLNGRILTWGQPILL